MAGVCGVWGLMGLLPGDEEVEREATGPPTSPGTLESCLDEGVLERCSMREEDIESDSWAVESRILANLVYCAVVR